jgi:hypothetical protein
MAEDGVQHSETIADYLEAGIAAAQAGQNPLARTLLTRVIEQDERNTAAWLWLSRVTNSPEEQEICLENVLTLEPGNAEAQGALAQVRARLAPPPPEAPARGSRTGGARPVAVDSGDVPRSKRSASARGSVSCWACRRQPLG